MIADQTSEIVELVSGEIRNLLRTHPLNLERRRKNRTLANVVLFRGCSRAPSFTKFDTFHNVIWNPTLMARTCIISGIGKELGFQICPPIENEHISENNITILQDLSSFIDSLHYNTSKFAFFHIKAVDEASHDYNFDLKVSLIEQIDQILDFAINKLIGEFDSDEFRIVLTGDHTTLCRIGEHSCEPVPFLISKPLTKNSQFDYDEEKSISTCFINNNMGRFTGESVVNFLKHIILE